MAQACSADLSCQAFATNGNLKGYLPSSVVDWDIFPNAAACDGLWVKIPQHGCPFRIPGFVFHQNKDLPNKNTAIQPAIVVATEWELAAACLNHRDGVGQPDCVGFTRDQWGGGVLWRAMTNPFDGWGKWMVTPSTPCGGMYVKECPRIPGYVFYSLLDSNHGDIGEQRTGMTLQQLAAECSGLSNCQSFNTQGYLKLAVKTIDLFQRLTGDPCKGLYVKESIPVCPYATPTGYKFEPQWNSFRHDLNEASADRGDWLGKVPQLAAVCNSNSQCAGFNTGGYTKSYVLKGTGAWGRLPGNMVWPGGSTGYPACDGIYMREALQCGRSGQYCATNRCCGGARCCLEGTKCCGKECCTASQQCCGQQCAAECVVVDPLSGSGPTTYPVHWVEIARSSESCFSSPSSNPPVICKASLLDFASTLSAQALPSDGGFDFAQALDVRSIAAFAIEMFNTAICSLTATGEEIRTFQFSTAFNKDAAASMQSLILGGLKWMGSMPMHDDHRYLYIPITADMWNLGPKMRAGALKDRIKELKARFPVLNYGMAMAINPCTHEYLFAFKGVSYPPPSSPLGHPLGYGLTARLTVNNLGLTPVQPLMNNKLPNINIDGGLWSPRWPKQDPIDLMEGNVYFKGTASINIVGLEKENFLNFIKLEVAVAETAVQILHSFNPHTSTTIHLKVAPKISVLDVKLPVEKLAGSAEWTLYTNNGDWYMRAVVTNGDPLAFVVGIVDMFKGLNVGENLRRMLPTPVQNYAGTKLHVDMVFASFFWGIRVGARMEGLERVINRLPFVKLSSSTAVWIGGSTCPQTTALVFETFTGGRLETIAFFFCHEDTDCPKPRWPFWQAECLNFWGNDGWPGVCIVRNQYYEVDPAAVLTFGHCMVRYTDVCPFTMPCMPDAPCPWRDGDNSDPCVGKFIRPT